MKKQILLAFAFLFSVITFAQKKEIKALEKAVKSNNYAEAKTLLSQLESMTGAMDDKTKSKFYFNKAKALYANGGGSDADINEAIATFENIKGYGAELDVLKRTMQNGFLTKANTQYTSGDYENAANGFERLYSVAPNDTIYLYYAASSAVSGKDYPTALKHYETLKNIGYTGIEHQYYATNKESGEEEVMQKSQRDLLVKAGSHIAPGERTTESKAAEITKNVALIYVSLDKTDEALAAIKEARANDPKNIDLLTTEANLEYKTGNKAGYKKLIEDAIQLDPNNPDLFFNLGVMAADSNDVSKAKEFYNKAIALDANNVNSLTNMAALILGQEQSIITEMNGLGSSAADNARYDTLKAQRTGLYSEALPFLEKVSGIDANNVDVLKTLKSIYGALGQSDKESAIKAALSALGN